MPGDADLKEVRELFAYDTQQWASIREEGAEDMRYVSGDPWAQADRLAREAAGRPCLALDELSQYVNQVINELRAYKRAIKFSPVGNGANDDTAEFYTDKTREIEYRSRAQIAYITAAENAIQRSYGWIRVNTRYEHPRSINQDIYIDAVHDPDAITPDPEAVMPDFSDMSRCWVRQPFDIDVFNERWPKFSLEKGGRLHTEWMGAAPTWVSARRVFVSEQWKIKTVKRTLQVFQLPDGTAHGFFEDELNHVPQGSVPQGTPRSVDDRQVCQYLTNGIEYLEDVTEWPGRYIPIIGCIGKAIYVDGKRQILSMVRLARDPYMLYCYYRTAEAEMVGMSTKFPYFVRRGSLSPESLHAIARSLHEPVAAIEVETTAEGLPPGLPPEMPVRNPFEPAIQALEVGAEGARRAIQSAMGLTPLPTTAQRRNEKSGVALKHIEETGQRGSYHFKDHFEDAITFTGVVVEDLMDKIYDSARDVGIRKPNDSAEIVRINDPQTPKSVSTHGDHLVTVSTGPSFDSEREAASDFADTLATASPEAFALLGPLIVKLKNLGPIGDEMAEILEVVQPPPVQALRQSKKQAGDPAQAQQELIATKAQLQKAMQGLQELQHALETEQAKQMAQVEKARIDAQAELAVAKMREATQIAIAKLNHLMKPAQQQEADAIEAELQRKFDLLLAEVEQQHKIELEQVKAEHAREADRRALAAGVVEGEQGHRHRVDEGERGHQQALESGERAVEGQIAVVKAKPPAEAKS